jgi:outer membrane protein OmpA-like peptidoglycan-associated protein
MTMEMTVKTKRLFYMGASSLALVCAACGSSAPSNELKTARSVYTQARNGEAARLNPAGVQQAYKALQSAEKAHEDDAGSYKERSRAYIAARRAELAIAEANEAAARQEQARAEQAAQQSYAQALQQTQQQLAQKEAEEDQRRLQELQAGKSRAEQEAEAARAQAQSAAARAEAQLRQSQEMRSEQGQLIISLSGVFFETGKADLSSAARSRLDTVATALSAHPDQEILVQGFTDAQGDEEKNRMLSQMRAEAVRQYLGERGIPQERLRAVGRGESDPIASNDTPSGRASNRRVEIVLNSSEQRTGATPTPAGQDRQNVRGTDSNTDMQTQPPRHQQQQNPQGQPQQQNQQKPQRQPQ